MFSAGRRIAWPHVLPCVHQKMMGRTIVTATKPVAMMKTMMTGSIVHAPVDTYIYDTIHSDLYDFRK